MVTNLIVLQVHDSQVLKNACCDDLGANIANFVLLDVKVFKVLTEFGDSQRHYVIDFIVFHQQLFQLREIVTLEQIAEALIADLVVVQSQGLQPCNKFAIGNVLSRCLGQVVIIQHQVFQVSHIAGFG